MTLSTFFFTYILGGLTFLPLLLAAVLVPAWLALPVVKDEDRHDGGGEKARNRADEDHVSRALPEGKSEGAASGTFVVLRRYDFSAAIGALNARHNTTSGGPANGGDGTGETTSVSESMYQSMYRSVFDRNKNAASTMSIMDNEDASTTTANTRPRKNITPANVFYIVLRHGHLMLYDSAAQIEVRHVISLAHHNVSLSSGEGNQEADIRDGDLFIKRTAIVLTPLANNDFSNQGRPVLSNVPKRPFVLFSPTCIEKEDFYHALLSTRNVPPIPRPLDTNDIIKLQSTLHSTNSLTPETRALNALISRLFLALHNTDRLKDIVRQKIEKKISRVQKPAFIAALAVHSVDLGDAAPVISNLRLKDLNISGDVTVACDVRYTGGVKVTVSALAKLDLGPRFKTRTADLLLSTSLPRFHGHALVRIKPPPSNRVWFCFESIPEMDVKVEPVVQSRQITYTFILRAIEERIRSVIGETLVNPNWDDISFFDTRGQDVRGGIWLKQREVDEQKAGAEVLKERNEKTKSTPAVISTDGVEGYSSAASSGSEATAQAVSATSAARNEATNELKRRSVASLPAEQEHQSPPPRPPRPLRSPSLASPSASVASVQLDDSPANVEPLRAETQPRAPQQSRWRIRPPPQQQSTRRDAIETMREMRDRAWHDREADDEHDDAVHSEPAESEFSEDRRRSDPTLTDRSLPRPKRTPTNLSSVSSSSSTTARSQRQQEAMQKGKTFLAAAGAATNAARNWSWNAIQNRGKGGRGAGEQTQQEPIGRGQPLPPPGVPLPGPQKGWLPPGVGIGSMKRKPVPSLPARKSTAETQNTGDNVTNQMSAETADREEEGLNRGVNGGAAEYVESPTADEFGPWRENSGVGLEDLEDGVTSEVIEPFPVEDGRSENEVELSLTQSGVQIESGLAHPATDVEATAVTKVPPPLPARPRPKAQESVAAPIEKGDDADTPEDVHNGHRTASGWSVPLPIQMESASHHLLHRDDPESEDTDAESHDRADETDIDDLVPISAPAHEDADETELETEGLKQVSDIDTSSFEDEQARKSLQDPVARDEEAVQRHGEQVDFAGNRDATL